MKKTNSIFSSVLIMLLFISISAFSQNKTIPNSFELLNNKDNTQTDFYKKSIEVANMEQFRLKNQRITIAFKNGFDLELLSATELSKKGISIDVNNYQEQNKLAESNPVFAINPEGIIVVMYTAKDAKYNTAK